MMLSLWCGFLLLTHFLCDVHSLTCNPTQYKDDNNMKCCNKCTPGKRMERRCNKNVDTVCNPCNVDEYMDEYSIEMECKRCTQCTKDNMVYEVKCSDSNDAVCACKSGYKCTGKHCTECVKIPTTPATTTTATTTTTTSLTTSSTTNTNTDEQPKDTVWITLSFCCVCILLTCFILISRRTPTCGWIMLASTGSFWWSKKNSAESSQCTEEEEVPMPVQEVCGYKEWQKEI